MVSACGRPVAGWIERCSFPNTDHHGSWLDDDALAPGLLEVLEVMGRDGVPILLDLARAVEGWADTRPADLPKMPSAVGTCETSLRDTKLSVAARPFALLSIQRVLDAYTALGDDERKSVDGPLSGTGFDALLAHQPRHRLKKEGYQLVFETS